MVDCGGMSIVSRQFPSSLCLSLGGPSNFQQDAILCRLPIDTAAVTNHLPGASMLDGGACRRCLVKVREMYGRADHHLPPTNLGSKFASLSSAKRVKLCCYHVRQRYRHRATDNERTQTSYSTLGFGYERPSCEAKPVLSVISEGSFVRILVPVSQGCNVQSFHATGRCEQIAKLGR